MIEALRQTFPEVAARPSGCFIVGGAVRDLLLGLDPADVDFAAADARAAASAFARSTGGTLVSLGGERFPTWRVVVEGRIYDFTDILGGSFEADLARRDFTIDALALDEEGGLVDLVGGKRDLEQRIVRMIREENLVEDPLRMLKGVRMTVALDFAIEPATAGAIRRHAAELARVAPERVTYEMNLILGDFDRPYGAGLLRDTGLARAVVDEGITDEALARLARIEDDDPIVGWAILLRERDVDAHARRWRWSEDDRLGVERLLRFAESEAELPIRLYDAGEDCARRLPRFLRALERPRDAEEIEKVLRDRGAEVFSLVPLLSGDEIQALLGISPGKEVGRIKRALVEAQLRGEVTSREEAERRVVECGNSLPPCPPHFSAAD